MQMSCANAHPLAVDRIVHFFRVLAAILALVVTWFVPVGTARSQAVGAFTYTDVNTVSITAGTVTASALVTSRTNMLSVNGWGNGGAGASTNFPGSWYTPTITPSTLQLFVINNASASSVGIAQLTYTFNVPVTNPIFQFSNLDSSRLDFTGTTTTTGSPVVLSKLSGNIELEVSGKLVNATPRAASLLGCEATDGTNPEGGCGSVQLVGTYSTITYTETDLNLATGSGDGHFIGLFLPADYGDAPSSYGSAAHIVNGTHMIGTSVDVENANQPGTGAGLDGSDEQGVTVPSFARSQTSIINVAVTGSGGYLSAWLDFGADGSFGAGDQIAADIQDGGVGDANPATGIIGISVTPSATASLVQTYARFRWSQTSGLSATGNASSGEVEDHPVTIGVYSISKTVDPPILTQAGTISYTITVDNILGGIAINAPTLTDTLLQGSTPRTLTSGPMLTSGDTNSDGIVDMGEIWTYSASYTVPQTEFDLGTAYTNSVSLTSSTATTRTSNTATTTLVPAPALSILKQEAFVFNGGTTSVADAGDTLNYTFLVTNTGNVTVSNVTVTETSFNGTGAPPGSPGQETPVNVPGGSTDIAQNGSWDSLRPGDSIRFTTISPYTVVQSDIDTLQ